MSSDKGGRGDDERNAAAKDEVDHTGDGSGGIVHRAKARTAQTMTTSWSRLDAKSGSIGLAFRLGDRCIAHLH